jgi:photosystem II stability/assembly factor-like uncharacterized protein
VATVSVAGAAAGADATASAARLSSTSRRSEGGSGRPRRLGALARRALGTELTRLRAPERGSVAGEGGGMLTPPLGGGCAEHVAT